MVSTDFRSRIGIGGIQKKCRGYNVRHGFDDWEYATTWNVSRIHSRTRESPYLWYWK